MDDALVSQEFYAEGEASDREFLRTLSAYGNADVKRCIAVLPGIAK